MYTCFAVQVSSEKVQRVHKIVFHGNNAMNDRSLAKLLTVSPGQKFDPKLIESSLHEVLTRYKKLGYMFARISWEATPLEKDRVDIRVTIVEGEIVEMGEIRLSGNKIFSTSELLDKFDVRKSRFFDESIFQSDMERLLKLYSDGGYPLVKISPSEFHIEDGRLYINIDIDEGTLTKIRQIQINGLKKTKESVVLRELAVHPNDIFDQRKIDESQRRLNNMGYFQDVSQISFSPAGADGVILSSSVVEGRTGQFSGLLGYNPSEGKSGERKFSGILEAAETNLFGTGRQITARFKVGLMDSYEFGYEEPWAFDKPVDLGVHLRGVRQTDALSGQSLREWAAGLSGATHIGRSIDGSLDAVYKRFRSSDSKNRLTNGEKYSLIFAVQRDSRDYSANPSMGRLDHTALEISRGDFKIVKAWLDLNQYFKTLKQQVLALRFHGARVWGERIPPTEMLYLGGANSLRGYSEDFFRGEGRLFANCEYRLLAGRNSQFFLFLDGGTYYKKREGLSSLKLGYGLGMRLESLNGLVSVDYGLAKGDPVLKGKIHVSLGATF